MPQRLTLNAAAERLTALAQHGTQLSDSDIDELLDVFPAFFRALMVGAGYETSSAKALTTKFRDAGRRSAPWRAVSGRVPGRPQDGRDGNRINRWLLPADHKQYATQRVASLVEARYYLQALSFENAPVVPDDDFPFAWNWLVDHAVLPGSYLDPIQLRSIDMRVAADDPRSITSGHLVPLDRGGKHEPMNAFLILFRSNQMQGNMTLDEFLVLADEIVRRHKANRTFPAVRDVAAVEAVQGIEAVRDS